MTEITNLTLENEMDLVVVHRRITSVAENIKLTPVTYTALSTAITEVGREIIDKTNTGFLSIFITQRSDKFYLLAKISLASDADVKESDEGLSYAKKLIPDFAFEKDQTQSYITMQIAIPRYLKLTRSIVETIAENFQKDRNLTPYEEIKAKKHLLEQLKQKHEEQILQTKHINAQKNEFISIASHELKTPITTIKAYSQLALRAEDPNTIKFYLTKINIQSDKLNTLILQLLDISKMETGKLEYNKEEVNFGAYIHETIPSLSHIYPKHTLKINIQDEDINVYIDKLRIEQVLTNLLNNASKYSGPDTNISIDCFIDTKNMMNIAVTDEGIGIDQENLSNIFTKFFREKEVVNSYSGFGMGLYITKNIVEEHKGNIWVESAKGKGSTFIFTLPILQ